MSVDRMVEALRAGFRRAADEAVSAAAGGRGGTFYPVGAGVHWSHACSFRVVQGSELAPPERTPSGSVVYGGVRPCPGSVVVRVSLPGGGGSVSFSEEKTAEVGRYPEHFVKEGPSIVLESIRASLLELTGAGVLWEDLLGFVRDSPAVDVVSR